MPRRAAIGLAAALVAWLALASSAAAVDPLNRPGAPTKPLAVSFGGNPVLVAWGNPVSDGGSPVRYFVVRTYNGYHVCTVPAPGPNTCSLGAVPRGRLEYPLVVKAVNTAGASPPTKIFHDQIVQLGSGSGASASGGTLSADGTGESASGTGAGGSAGSAAGSPAAAELPFTGANLSTLLVVALLLLLMGCALETSAGQRRWVLRRLSGWTFGD